MAADEISGVTKINSISNNNMSNTNMLFIGLSIISLLILIVVFIRLLKLILLLGNTDTKYDKYIKKILNEYDRLIVETTHIPDFDQCDIIKITKFTELLDVRDNLKLPIMYYSVVNHHKAYFFIKKDDDIYLFVVKESDF